MRKDHAKQRGDQTKQLLLLSFVPRNNDACCCTAGDRDLVVDTTCQPQNVSDIQPKFVIAVIAGKGFGGTPDSCVEDSDSNTRMFVFTNIDSVLDGIVDSTDCRLKLCHLADRSTHAANVSRFLES